MVIKIKPVITNYNINDAALGIKDFLCLSVLEAMIPYSSQTIRMINR